MKMKVDVPADLPTISLMAVGARSIPDDRPPAVAMCSCSTKRRWRRTRIDGNDALGA